MLLLIALLSCRLATVSEPCVDDPQLCPACESDNDCAFMGNSCYETVDCAHVDAGLAYPELGCSQALEYSWPDDSECVCRASVCRYSD